MSMDFGQAISQVVYSGARVTRASWSGAIVIRDGDTIRKVGGIANTSSEYEPKQADMLADDWGYAGVVADPNAPELALPFKGDAWPGGVEPEMPPSGRLGGPDDPRVPEVEDAAVGGPNVPHAVIVPPGGFVSTVNDPHAAENRDPDAV